MKIGRIFYVYALKEMVRIEKLLDARVTHNSINFLLIDVVTYARMQKSLGTRGDRTIDQQWIHIHNTRMQWLEICAKDIFNTDCGSVIVQSNWPKRLLHRHYTRNSWTNLLIQMV